MTSTPEDEVTVAEEASRPNFDIFVQNVDLRWCLLICCDYASLAALRKLGLQDVPIALNSEEWCASSPANSVALHAAQWAAGREEVLHKPLSKPIGLSIIRLYCENDEARQAALANGAQRDESGHPIIALNHPVGVEQMMNAAQITAMAPPMAPFLHDPLERTTTIEVGATHNGGPVQSVSAVPSAIAHDDAAAPARVRAYRSRHLVASGGLDGISRVARVSATKNADALRSAPLSIQGALRHGGGLSAVEVRPSGTLLTACGTSSTMRVYELEAAHLAAERIAAAGMPATMVPTTSRDEWNYVERARVQDEHAPHGIIAARWLDEKTLVEVGDEHGGPPNHVSRTWRIGTHQGTGPGVSFLGQGGGHAVSALAAGDGLVVTTHNEGGDDGVGYAEVRRLWDTDASAPPSLLLLGLLSGHTAHLFACAVGGGLIATGGDDCTVRLWSRDQVQLPELVADESVETPGPLQTLQLPGKVWALALHSHMLVVGGALASDAGALDSNIRVRLYDVVDLAAGRGNAVALRTLQAPSIAHDWGVRTVATHGGTVVVAGGDDGVVHVWTLAEKEKADRGAVTEGGAPAGEESGAPGGAV